MAVMQNSGFMASHEIIPFRSAFRGLLRAKVFAMFLKRITETLFQKKCFAGSQNQCSNAFLEPWKCIGGSGVVWLALLQGLSAAKSRSRPKGCGQVQIHAEKVSKCMSGSGVDWFTLFEGNG